MPWNNPHPTRAERAFVQVWRLPLPAGPEDERLLAWLEPAERQRAQRYGNPQARRRFLLCRAALRCLLAQRLQTEPAALSLLADGHGKPCLAQRPADLSFNVSHTHELALIALSSAPLLGVDVEAWRPMRALPGLAQRCFAAQEFSRWQALPEAAQMPAFFQLWTRKEAFAKAVGRGIALGLERIVFDAQGKLAAVPADCGVAADWRVEALEVGVGYSAALAVAGSAAPWEWRDFAWPANQRGV